MITRSGQGWEGHGVDRPYHWIERIEETDEGRLTEYGSAYFNNAITDWWYTLDVPDPKWYNKYKRRIVKRWKVIK